MKNERRNRLDALGLSVSELAASLSVTGQFVLDWLAGTLPCEEDDIIDVGVSLLEMRILTARASRDAVTERILLVA